MGFNSARGRRFGSIYGFGTGREPVPGGLRSKHPCFSRSRNHILTQISAFIAASVASFGIAASVSPLDRYLEGLKTLRTDFIQTLVDAHGKKIDRAAGTLIVARPGKFRWEVKPQRGSAEEG